MIYIFWTCKDVEEAKKIAHGLLEKRWIACASIIPTVVSVYRWQGKIEEGSESKVMLKTEKKYFEKIQEYIQKNCSYEVPEIVEIPAERGNPRYLKWISEETLNPA